MVEKKEDGKKKEEVEEKREEVKVTEWLNVVVKDV